MGLKSAAFTFRGVAFRVLGPTVTGTQAMLDRTRFKECAFAAELSGHINRCLQLPLCIWGIKSNTSQVPDVDYKVSVPTVTGTQAMLH